MASPALPRTPTISEPTVTGIPPLGPYLRGVWERRPLIWHLARTDLKSEHYDTAIGQFWIILDPLLMAAVYYLVRSVIRPPGGEGDQRVLIAHLVWGIFFFHYTSKSLQSGARSILANKGLILNSAFPRAVFPLVAILEGFLMFIPTLLVYFGLHAILGQPFGPGLIFIPLMIVLQTFLTLGLALFFAPLMVFFRDASGFMPYVTRVWLYLTPVLFTVAEIPAQFRVWFRVNPLYPFFAALEQIFTGGLPSFGYIVAAGAWATVFFLVGSVVFLLRERDFATRF